MGPLVSIITPSYNSSLWIKETYKSIVAQTYVNWEWIVTDDCSSDSTVLVLRQLAKKDPRIKIFENEINSGAAVSRNNSIANSTGDFLAFIDSDDTWLPEKLERQLEFMGDEISFSFTAYGIMDAKSNVISKTVDSSQEGFFTYKDMLRKKATLGCSTVILRKASFDEICMPLIRTGQDYALWLDLLRSGKNAYVLNEVLTRYRILPNSISRNKLKKAKRQWQIYRELERLGLIDSLVNFCFYVYRALIRKS